MQEKEFDKRVKEILDEHLEMVDENSWDRLEVALNNRQRSRLVYFRRSIYVSVAVAASLLLFLVLGKESPVPASIEVFNNKEVVAQDSPKSQINVEVKNQTISNTYISQTSISQTRKKESDIGQNSIANPVIQEKEAKKVAEQKVYQPYNFEEETVSYKREKKRLL